MHVDHLGNLVTNIRASQLPTRFKIVVGDHSIDHVSERFADVGAGHLLAIIGSTGNLEISVNRGSAAERLFVSASEQVWVKPVEERSPFTENA